MSGDFGDDRGKARLGGFDENVEVEEEEEGEEGDGEVRVGVEEAGVEGGVVE